MTTTPAQTGLDLDAIRARLMNAIDGPWAIWPDLRPEGLITIGDATGVIPEGETWTEGPSNTVAHVYTEEDADFIVHAPEDIRALLDELAKLRRELSDANLYGYEMAGQVVNLCRDMGKVQGERDAARKELANTQARVATLDERVTTWKTRLVEETATLREELAKTRAELETARAVALSNKRAHATAFEECERLAAELAEARKVIACRDAALDASTETHHIAQQIVLATLGASPATTAEPADEPKADHDECDGTDHPGMTCDQYDTALEPTPPGQLVLAPLTDEPAAG